MKTNLQVSGNAELSRHEISQAILEYVEKHYNFKATKIVYELPNQTDIKAIIEIKDVTTNVEEKLNSYKIKEVKKSNQPFGVSRPNHGIGLFLADIFETGQIVALSDVFKKTQGNFPKLTLPILKTYLKREAMVGFKIDEANGYYQRADMKGK